MANKLWTPEKHDETQNVTVAPPPFALGQRAVDRARQLGKKVVRKGRDWKPDLSVSEYVQQFGVAPRVSDSPVAPAGARAKMNPPVNPDQLSPEAYELKYGIPPMRGGAVTATWYGPVLQWTFDDSGKPASLGTPVDWNTDTIKCSLHTTSYAPDQDTHTDHADTTNETTGSGYSAGGDTLTTAAVTLDTTNDRLELDADDAQWTTASFSAYYAVIYKSTGTAANDPLLGYVDFGGTETVSSGTFTITWDAEGILQIAY